MISHLLSFLCVLAGGGWVWPAVLAQVLQEFNWGMCVCFHSKQCVTAYCICASVLSWFPGLFLCDGGCRLGSAASRISVARTPQLSCFDTRNVWLNENEIESWSAWIPAGSITLSRLTSCRCLHLIKVRFDHPVTDIAISLPWNFTSCLHISEGLPVRN